MQMSGQPLQRLVLEERLRGSSLAVVNYLLLCLHLHGPYYKEVTSDLQVSWGEEGGGSSIPKVQPLIFGQKRYPSYTFY